MSVHLAV